MADLASLGKTGSFISDPSEMGGFGEIKGGAVPIDTDQDGIPDDWEKDHHLNPRESDAGQLAPSGYTRLERVSQHLAMNQQPAAMRVFDGGVRTKGQDAIGQVARMKETMVLLSRSFLAYLLFAALSTAFEAEARTPADVVKDGRPIFKVEKYFAGRTHSWGIFETRSGEPKEILHTQTWGRWDGGILQFEQDLEFQSGKKSHRSWLIRRLDRPPRRGDWDWHRRNGSWEAYGNTLHLEFTLDAVPGNPLAHLHMSQWMYLQADGVTMVNRDTLTKAGVIITEITEQFHKDG